MDSVNIKELNDRIQSESAFVDILTMEMGKVIVLEYRANLSPIISSRE